MLSGKNKQRFKRWYKNKFGIMPFSFNDLRPEMRKGVYEKYFDSLGYYITTDYSIVHKFWLYVISKKDEAIDLEQEFKTRLEAFTEAVKQLDKLINEEL